MRPLRNILIVTGIMTVILFVLLLVFGVQRLGIYIAWICGMFAVLFLVGWGIYTTRKPRGGGKPQ